RNDTITFVGIAAAIVLIVPLVRRRALAGDERAGRLAALAAGVLATSVYVVYIGGDFMAGRHWAAPFLLAVIVLVDALRERGLATELPLLQFACAALACRFAIEPMIAQRNMIETREQGRFAIVRKDGIRDQRFNCSFFEALFGSRGPITEHSWAKDG